MPGRQARTTTTASANAGSNAQVGVILLTVFLAYMGQMVLNPIIATLSRGMGLKEWHIGAAVSLAAVTLALLSQFWGRRSQRSGVRPVLVASMTVGAIALASSPLWRGWGCAASGRVRAWCSQCWSAAASSTAAASPPS